MAAIAAQHAVHEAALVGLYSELYNYHFIPVALLTLCVTDKMRSQ